MSLGIQYRIVHNLSNIPGPGGTTFTHTETYDFFRQRLRLNFNLAPRSVPAGGFLQREFRGGFGGSSPNVSDPRGQEPSRNPCNRLQARGVRYGFLYAQPTEQNLVLAGILPLSDELGDTLFSADWDFNVGGAALLGSTGPANYRLAYLRLIEAVGVKDACVIGKDRDFYLADFIYNLENLASELRETRVGLHGYYLNVGKGLPLGDTDEVWIGASVHTSTHFTRANAFAVANFAQLGEGELDANGNVISGFDHNDAHTGFAIKFELLQQIGRLNVAFRRCTQAATLATRFAIGS